MKQTGAFLRMGLFTVALAGCFLLVSCSLPSLFEDGASQDIRKVVTSYLDDMKSGKFSNNGYVSEFAGDASFADLTFADDDMIQMMDAGLLRIEYTVDQAKGSVKYGEGICDITVTAVDLEAALLSLEDQTLKPDSLLSLIEDEDVPIKEYQISLDMVYDSNDKAWLVLHTAPLALILGHPYTKIFFGPAAGSPTNIINTFITALSEGDTAAIDLISPNITSATFFDDNENSKNLQQKFYSEISYEIRDEPSVEDIYAYVDITLTMPDLIKIKNQIANDLEFMAGMQKPYLLTIIRGEDSTVAKEQSMKVYNNKLEEIFSSASVPVITYDAVFVVEANKETGKWVLSDIPPELCSINPEPDESEELYGQAALLALDMLLAEGSINDATYDEFAAYYKDGGTTIPTEMTLATDVNYFYWYDYKLEKQVDNYISATTALIEFNIYFNKTWPGTKIYTVWYNGDGTRVYTTMDYTMDEDDLSYVTYIVPAEGEYMPPDTYRVVLSLKDGTLIADESVTVR